MGGNLGVAVMILARRFAMLASVSFFFASGSSPVNLSIFFRDLSCADSLVQSPLSCLEGTCGNAVPAMRFSFARETDRRCRGVVGRDVLVGVAFATVLVGSCLRNERGLSFFKGGADKCAQGLAVAVAAAARELESLLVWLWTRGVGDSPENVLGRALFAVFGAMGVLEVEETGFMRNPLFDVPPEDFLLCTVAGRSFSNSVAGSSYTSAAGAASLEVVVVVARAVVALACTVVSCTSSEMLLGAALSVLTVGGLIMPSPPGGDSAAAAMSTFASLLILDMLFLKLGRLLRPTLFMARRTPPL